MTKANEHLNVRNAEKKTGSQAPGQSLLYFAYSLGTAVIKFYSQCLTWLETVMS